MALSTRRRSARERLLGVAIGSAIALSTAAARAEETPDGDAMSYSVLATSYLRLFQRRALPGPGGALVSTETRVPIYQYAQLRVHDVDAPWRVDSIDLELSGWGTVEPGDVGLNRRVDGDVTVANVTHRLGPVYTRVGRQIRVGGAARFSHFDGLSVGGRTELGLGGDAYGGFAVLPRWTLRPGYHWLGSAADSLAHSPEALPDPDRLDHWLAGGRVYYKHASLIEAGLSFHNTQQEGGMGRRDLGLDLRSSPLDMVDITASGLLDTDAWRLAQARGAVDFTPLDELTVSGELMHATPSLLLSQQSVLSVFSVDAYNEAGLAGRYRPLKILTATAGGYLQRFDGGSFGARSAVGLRLRPEHTGVTIGARYGHVVEPTNGYHSIRATVGYRVIDPLMLTAEGYAYFYNEPIRDVASSLVWAMNGDYSWADWGSALLGGSVARTPYAEIDAQALARLTITLDGGSQ